jgi:hypothetical protein
MVECRHRSGYAGARRERPHESLHVHARSPIVCLLPSDFAHRRKEQARPSLDVAGVVVRAIAVAILVGVCIPAASAATSPCAVSAGERVMLRSSDFDPDVLVWDSRQRVIDYVSGGIRSTTEVLVHTLLSKPGTQAVVTACDPGSAKPRYSTVAEDTIGIKITTGPNRGRYGWVSSSDTHGNAPAMAATP